LLAAGLDGGNTAISVLQDRNANESLSAYCHTRSSSGERVFFFRHIWVAKTSKNFYNNPYIEKYRCAAKKQRLMI